MSHFNVLSAVRLQPNGVRLVEAIQFRVEYHFLGRRCHKVAMRRRNVFGFRQTGFSQPRRRLEMRPRDGRDRWTEARAPLSQRLMRGAEA